MILGFRETIHTDFRGFHTQKMAPKCFPRIIWGSIGAWRPQRFQRGRLGEIPGTEVAGKKEFIAGAEVHYLIDFTMKRQDIPSKKEIVWRF